MDKPTPQATPPDTSHRWDRIKAALRRDWEQTRHDFSRKWGDDLKQGVGHTVQQAMGREAIPSRHVANESDAWSDEAAVRFGYDAARSPNYRDRGEWSGSMETSLRSDWEAMRSGRPWDEVRMAVRYGWMRAKGEGRD